MKNSLRLYSVFFIVIIAFALNSCASKKKALVLGTKLIILLVDTENIRPGSDPKDYCSFPGQPQHPPRDSIENYTTGVLPGDSVIWIGISTSAPIEDKVSIEMINWRSGNKVLGPQKSINGKVEGKIKEDAKRNQEETYAIHFRVIKEGSPPNTYILDPKLLVH